MVLKLDTTYQAAVKASDMTTMEKLMADDFSPVTGSCKLFTKLDWSREVRNQTDSTVRVWGDTAVTTAKLWEKGPDSGTPFDKPVWFSDTYVRIKTG